MLKRIFALFTGLALAAVLWSLGVRLVEAPPVRAASFLVSNTQDSGPGSLRQAIAEANQQPGQDTITFDPSLGGQFILLSSGAITISDDLAVIGPGASLLAIRGDGSSTLLHLASGIEAAFQAITLEQSTSAITAAAARLELVHSTIRDNQQGLWLAPGSTVVISRSTLLGNSSGALFAAGATGQISESEISGNQAVEGGGLHLSGPGLWLLADSLLTNNQASLHGGAVFVGEGAQLQVTNSEILSNRAEFGAGLANFTGTLSLRDSRLAGNLSASRGGGLYHFSSQPLHIENSLIQGNNALWGGGIYLDHGSASLTGSTLAGNWAQDGVGGAIYAGSGRTSLVAVITLTNSTLSDNRAAWNGGGVGMGNASFSLRNVTIFGNLADADGDGDGDGGGIAQFGESSLALDNSIVAGNLDRGGQANDCAEIASSGGGVSSDGHNLLQDLGSCTISPGSGDQFGVDPLLDGQLQDNGGPTPTHALLAGSPAIDGGDCSGGLVTVDQRGVLRGQFSACDIGAYENGFLLWLPLILALER